jgi:hypothetical protein
MTHAAHIAYPTPNTGGRLALSPTLLETVYRGNFPCNINHIFFVATVWTRKGGEMKQNGAIKPTDWKLYMHQREAGQDDPDK